uniref:Uncharacterized protein n=1 Tax=Moschus moschiferus TaxID=68415 RepID=A0A8C6D4K6_MOSMO
MYTEDRIKVPGAQPSLGLRPASNRADEEPTISEVSQAAFPDADAMDSGPRPSPALGAPEAGPGRRDASEGFPQLGPQEQRLPAGPGTKLSSWVPQEGPRELQADRDPPMPGSELGVPPNRVPATQEGLQQQVSGKETEDQQGSQWNPGPVEGQGPESRQVMSTESRAGGDGMPQATTDLCSATVNLYFPEFSKN